VRVTKKLRGSAVKGTLRVQPAGVDLRLVLKAGRRTAGRHAYPAAGGRLAFSIKLDKKGRQALRRHEKLTLVLHVQADGKDVARKTVRLRIR